jgi:2-phosphosulfolactate phosphatase
MTEPEQQEFDAFQEWSAEGAVLLARVCPVVVVVDVLRFTTAVEVAVARGSVVVPRRSERVGGRRAPSPARSSTPGAAPRPGPGPRWPPSWTRTTSAGACPASPAGRSLS